MRSLRIKLTQDVNDNILSTMFMLALIIKGTNMTFGCTDIIPVPIEQCVLTLIIGAYVILLLQQIAKEGRRFHILIWAISIILSTLYLRAYLLYPGIRNITIKRFIWSIPVGMVCFSSMYRLRDIAVFKERAHILSYVFTLLGTIVFVWDNGELSSNISFSAMMLFPFALHIIMAHEKKKILIWIISVYELLIIFLHGSRGGFLYASMILITTLIMKNYRGVSGLKTIMSALVIIAALATAAVIHLNEIFLLLQEKGLYRYTRNMRYIVSSIFFDNNGRSPIQEKYIKAVINDMPVQGRIVDIFKVTNNYPHNVFIEVLYDYGYLVGLILIFLVSIFVLMGFTKGEGWFDIFLPLFGGGMLPLFTSFTYLEWPLFWGMLGFVTNYKRRRSK